MVDFPVDLERVERRLGRIEALLLRLVGEEKLPASRSEVACDGVEDLLRKWARGGSAEPRTHMLPPNLEYHRVPGRGMVIVLDSSASDFAVGDHLVVEERGTWQVRGIECTRVGGTGAVGKTCGLPVDGYPNKED